MADLGKLVIDVVAQNKQILANLNQVEKRVQSFERSVSGRLLKVEGGFNRLGTVVGKIQGVFAAVQAAAAIGGLTALVKNALETGDAIVDLSGKLGLSTTALQEYQFAAQLSGLSAEQFQTSVERLNRSIAEAAGGNKKLSQAFSSLGISLVDAQGTLIPTETALTKLLVRISEIPSPAQRTQVAMELMGRSAGNMTILAAEGAEGLARLRQQAHELGVVIDNETLRKASDLNDKWDAMAHAIKARLIPAFVALAPHMLAASDAAAKGAENWGAWLNEIQRFKLSSFSSGFKAEIGKIQKQREELQKELAAGPEQTFVTRFGGISDAELQRDFQARIAPQLEARIAELKKKEKELISQFEDLVNPGTAPVPSVIPPAQFDASLATGDAQKADRIAKGPKGPDFESIRNRFAEEAARRELQLQREIADATGRTSQFQIAALAEIEAARQIAIHQARGDAVALTAIERTAALERQALEIEVTQRATEEQQRRLDLAAKEAEQRTQLIDMAAQAQRTELQIQEQQGAFALQIAEQRGASVEQLVNLYQQQAGVVVRLGQVESDNLGKQIAATQEVIARVRERYQTESDLLAQLEAQRAAATGAIEQGVLDAKIRILRDSVDEVGGSYLQLVSRVAGWSDQQKQTEAQVRESLARIGQDLQDLQAPVSQRVWEQMGRDAQGSADRMAGAWVNAFDQAADGLAEFATTGKGNFKELLRSIETDLLRTINKEIFKNLFGQLLGVGQTGQPPDLFGSIIDVISKSPRPAIGAQAVQPGPTATPLIQFPLPTVQPPLLPPQVPQTADIFHGLDQQLQAIGNSVGRIDTLSQTGIERIGALGGNALQRILSLGSSSLEFIAQLASQSLALIQAQSGQQEGGGILGSLFGGLFGGSGGSGGTSAAGPVFTAGQTPGFNVPFLHDGNLPGARQLRAPVAPEIFMDAPRLHGGLKQDEFPAILQTGEAVLSRVQTAQTSRAGEMLSRMDSERPKTATQRGMAGETHIHNWNITTPDVNSFRKAQGQVQAAAARQLTVANRRNN